MNKIKHFDANVVGRDFVMGDLHGCLGALESVLSQANFDASTDRLFCVGDLVDRGPNSLDVIDYWMKSPWFHACKGNHEDMICKVHNDQWDPGNLIINGGSWFAFLTPEQQQLIVENFEALPDAIVVGKGTASRFNVLHAEWFGSDELLDIGETQWAHEEGGGCNRIHWGRVLINAVKDSLKPSAIKSQSTLAGSPPLEVLAHSLQGLSTTYVGHTIVGNKPLTFGPFVYLDTGAYKNTGSKNTRFEANSARGSLSMIQVGGSLFQSPGF